MDFVDATLIRLADPSTRVAVFDQPVLEQIARSAYDADALTIDGPYNAVFNSFELGVTSGSIGTVEGTVRDNLGGVPKELRLQVSGLGPNAASRVDAIWRGSVIARTVPVESRITTVQVEFATDDIDSTIIETLGSLPAEPEGLEAARRTELIASMRKAMAQPDLLTDAAFDNWLSSLGVSSVSELINTHRGSNLPAVLQIEFSAPGGAAPTPRSLPIVAALLIRNAPVAISELLIESKTLRDDLIERGMEVPRERGLPARNPFMVVWIVPISLFDDDDWPGSGANPAALRADRRARASVWLGQEGIAIAGIEE